MSKESFTIKTSVFEGPLDLLLSLIEKRKLHINDISLVAVTDDFIAYVEELKEFPVSQTADFIVVASTLLLIKSRSLLPSIELSEEETESIKDLERRLALYRRFKQLSHYIREQFGKRILFPRTQKEMSEPVFSPPAHLTTARAQEAMSRVLKNLPKKERLREAVVEKVVSLEEMIERLTKRITEQLEISFREFAGSNGVRRIDVIVSFLAMLELVKQGVIKAAQESHFSDILMESEHVHTPRY
jgi:segregation and condensation protein A